MSKRTDDLAAQILELRTQLETELLLAAIWQELGPYTNHLTNALRYKLQDHFDFDDSE